MSYNVYKVRYRLMMQDPDSTTTRFHTVIFVETKADGSGWMHHVEGEIVKGMKYNPKSAKQPNSSETYHSKDFIGKILKSDYPDAVNRVCEAQPPPGPQKAYNPKTNRTEQVKPDGTFYAPGEARPPLIKCTEWTENQAIPALKAAGILKG